MDSIDTPQSIGKMLLVSPSSLTMYQLAKSAHRFAMSVEVCTNARTALDLVNRQKFDAVTVDLALGQPATAILQEMHLPASRNRTAVAFAISGNKDERGGSVQCWFEFCTRKAINVRLNQMDATSGTRFDPPRATSILPLPNCNSSGHPTGRNAPGLWRIRKYQRRWHGAPYPDPA